MNIEGLVLNCPDCSSWFTGKERLVVDNAATSESGLITTYYCPSCLDDRGTDVELLDAHECHIQTPYQALREEFIKKQIGMLEYQIRELESDLEECGV